MTGAAREHPTSPRAAAALELIRGGYGALQLALPGLVADRLLAHRFDPRGRRVARVLGARQLVQALGSGRRPSYPVLAVGVEVDLLHAASMLGLGLVDRRRRRVALADAVIAGSFALAGTAAARGGRRVPLPPRSDLDRLRDRLADWVARIVVPGYPPVPTGVFPVRPAHGNRQPRAAADLTGPGQGSVLPAGPRPEVHHNGSNQKR